jgi:hypothetical protein
MLLKLLQRLFFLGNLNLIFMGVAMDLDERNGEYFKMIAALKSADK